MYIRITQAKISELALCLLIILMPLNHITLPEIGAAYQFVLLIVAFMYLVIIYKQKDKILYLNRETKAWAVFLLYQSITVIWSENLSRSINQLIGLVEIFIVAVLVINGKYFINGKKKIYNSFVIAGIVYIIFAQFFTIDQIYTGRKMITFGNFGSMDPNEWCSYMIIPIAIVVARLFDEKRIYLKAIYTIYVILTIYCALLEGSRGGMLALLITILIIVKNKTKLKATTLVGGVLFCFLLVFVVWKYILPLVPETVLNRYTIEGMTAYGGAGGRGSIWTEILEFLWNHPLKLLVGNGLYGAMSVSYVAHDQFLQVLLDTGVIGLILYLNLLICLLKRANKNGLVEIGSFIGMQVAMLSLTGYSWLKSVWIVFIICMLDYTSERDEREIHEET